MIKDEAKGYRTITKNEAEAAALKIMRAWALDALNISTRSVLQAAFNLIDADKRAASTLPTPIQRVREGMPEDQSGWYDEDQVANFIADDRKDILAHAEKLPRYAINVQPPDPNCGTRQAIFLSDLRNLLEGK
jgi:hypothetical protein